MRSSLPRWLAILGLCLPMLPLSAQTAAAGDTASAAIDALLQRASLQIRINPDASAQLAQQALARLGPNGPLDQRIRALALLCEHESERDRNRALERLALGKSLLTQAPRPALQARLLSCEGDLRETAGDGDGALTLYEQGVLAAEQGGEPAVLAQSLYDRGFLRGMRSEYANGLSDLKRAAKLYDELDMPSHRTAVQSGIAAVYNRMGDAEQARHFYESALRYQQQAGLKRQLVVTWHNLGRVHETLKDWLAAEQAFGASLALSRELAYARGQAYALRGLGGVMNATGRPAESLPLLDQAATLQRGWQDERLRGLIQLQRGIAFRLLQRPVESRAALRDALAVFQQAQAPAESARAHEALAQLAADGGEWREAHAQLQAFKALSDKLLRRQIDDRFATLKADVDRVAQDQKVRLLQREQHTMSVALEQARLAGQLRTAAVALALLSAALLAMLAWRLRRSGAAMRRLAMTDDLTGLPNRRDVLQRLDDSLARGGRCALLIVDLDHFKRINDTHGHPAGDGVLRAASDVLREVGREPVALGRLGGEEFVLVLPAADLHAAQALAERVRAAIEGMNVSAWMPEGPVTTSVGVTVSAAGERTSDLLRRADRALYLAKARGRNRVEVVSAEEEIASAAVRPLAESPATTPGQSPPSVTPPHPTRPQGA